MQIKKIGVLKVTIMHARAIVLVLMHI